MSKQTDDLIDRIEGTCVALKGVKFQLTPLPALVPTSADQVYVPPKEVTQEDYARAKKLAEELKNLAGDLEAEISRESKVPEDAGKSKSTAKV